MMVQKPQQRGEIPMAKTEEFRVRVAREEKEKAKNSIKKLSLFRKKKYKNN